MSVVFLRFAGAECRSRISQANPKILYVWVRGAKNAARDPIRVLERRHSLAEIAERGAGVLVERESVTLSHPEREFMTLPENTSRHRHRFAH